MATLEQNWKVEDGGHNYLSKTIGNTIESNIQRRVWETTEKPAECYQRNLDMTMTETKKVQGDINHLKASLEHT